MQVWYNSRMTKQDIQRQLEAIMKQSPYRGNVRRISLFGSQLHGKAKMDSDIDLLIELQKPMSLLKLVRMERELSEALGKKVDLSTPMSLSRYFRDDVMKEAETLYEVIA